MHKTERLRQAVKTALSFAFYYSGGLWAYRRTAAGNRPVILMYHRVLDRMEDDIDYSPDGMTLSTDIFDMQMEYLSRHYDVVPLTELIRILDGPGAARPNLCSITFDDGWKDVYDNAYPVLRKYGLSATIFLTTEYVEGKMPFWEERLRYLISAVFKYGLEHRLRECATIKPLLDQQNAGRKAEAHIFINEFVRRARQMSPHLRPGLLKGLEEALAGVVLERKFLSWAEAEEMAANGMEFGSHTVTHTSMNSCDIQTLRDEIVNSKRIIEQKLGLPVTTFAYPYGKHHPASGEILKDADFVCACSTTSGFVDKGSDRMLLKRINIHQDVSFCRPMFACRITRPFNLF